MRLLDPRPRRPARAALLWLLLCALLPAASARPAAPDTDAAAFLARLEAAWQTRDLEGWLSLWDFANPEEKAFEEETVRTAFSSDETVLSFLRRPTPAEGAKRFGADVQVFAATEPRAQVSYWRLSAERRAAGWAIVNRQEAGQVDGLVHLSLGPRAWRARGVSLRLEDFELRMEDGTLFTTPETLGPTAFAFVGRARVRFSPAPPSEREQVRQFSGEPAMDREVGWAFIRLHPADFHSALETGKLEPETDPGPRRAQAERVWQDRSQRSFTIDAALPRSPWWLMPSLGDAIVDFPWGRKRVLTFALSAGEPEDVNLFDRDRRFQICSYPSGGRAPRYSEDDRRVVDVLDNDITARFDPERLELVATHTMRVRMLSPAPTLRLRLHDDFRVASVTTEEGGSLLFFRVRDQGNLVVSLGPLARREEPFTLTTRYSGRHDPAPVDQELVQLTADQVEDTFVDQRPLVYSNRTAWYPRPPNEDFATARVRIESPAGWLGVTGGELVSLRTEGGRTRAEYRLEQPGKFVTAIVGRLADVGLRQEGEQAVRGFAGPRMRGETLDQMLVAQEMLAFYARRFGPSPFPTLGLVVAEGETPGGHSPPGLVYLQVRPPALRSRSLPEDPSNFSDLPGFFLAHETAHQWWGEGMAPANYRERWLSEAWAQYSAALWLRERLGEGAFRGMMDRMARWATRFDSSGPIHLGQRLGPPRAGRARLPGGRVRQGRLGAPHAEGRRGRRGFLRRGARLSRALPLREGGHRGLPGGARNGERARPAPLLRAVDLRDRPPGAPLVLPDGEDRRRLPNDDRRPTAGPAGPRASAAVDGDGNRKRDAHRHRRARGRLVDDGHQPEAAARDAERRPRAARPRRAGRPRAAPASVAVAAPLVLQRRDLRLGLGELLLVLFQEGGVGRAARTVVVGVAVHLDLHLVDDVLVDGLFLAGLVELLAPEPPRPSPGPPPRPSPHPPRPSQPEQPPRPGPRLRRRLTLHGGLALGRALAPGCRRPPVVAGVFVAGRSRAVDTGAIAWPMSPSV